MLWAPAPEQQAHGPSLPRDTAACRLGSKPRKGLCAPGCPTGALGVSATPTPPSGTWECPGQVAVTGPHSPRLPGSCSAAEDGSPGSPAVGAQRSHARGFGGATAAAPRKRGRPPAASIAAGAAGDSMCLFLLCALEVLPGSSSARARAQLTWSPEQLTSQLPLGWGSQAPAPPTFDVSALLSPQERTFLLLLPLHLPTWEPGTGPRCGFPGAQGGVGLGLPSPGGHSPAVPTACPRIALFPVRPRETHTPSPSALLASQEALPQVGRAGQAPLC